MSEQREDVQRRFVATTSSAAIHTGFQRYERPVYDYDDKASPCRAGCPAGHDIAWALYLVAQGREDLADETFRTDSPFPSITGRVCYHPCESVCNRGAYDGAVAINALERSFSDRGTLRPAGPAAVRYSETVGIVGSGPTGLTCAYHAAHLGYRVTIYEAKERPGGVLAFGIPGYRLPRKVVDLEIDRLRALGIDFQCGVHVGRDIPFADLASRHQALFLGTGLTRARVPDVPLPGDPRIISGLSFLESVARGESQRLHGRVAVLGGGDVAIDAARTALRLGAARVVIYSPEAADSMPAHPEEVVEALRESVDIRDRRLPALVEASPDKIRVRFRRVLAATRNSDGRLKFEAEQVMLAPEAYDFLIYALGQQHAVEFLPPEVIASGRIEVGEWGETVLPGVFAGGDITGVYNVVNAIASGKRAAVGIDARLRGLSTDGLAGRVGIGGRSGSFSMSLYHAWRRGEPAPAQRRLVPLSDINLDYFPPVSRTQPVQRSPGSGAHAFRETNLALSPESALREAGRCFNCGMCNMCGNCFRYCPDSSVIQKGDWGFSIDTDHCKGCGICVQECPRSAMSMIPETDARAAESMERL